MRMSTRMQPERCFSVPKITLTDRDAIVISHERNKVFFLDTKLVLQYLFTQITSCR